MRIPSQHKTYPPLHHDQYHGKYSIVYRVIDSALDYKSLFKLMAAINLISVTIEYTAMLSNKKWDLFD
jgi:hypothetical protein